MQKVHYLKTCLLNPLGADTIFIKDGYNTSNHPIEIKISPSAVIEVKANIGEVIAGNPEYGDCVSSILISGADIFDWSELYSKQYELGIDSASAVIYLPGGLEKLEHSVENDPNLIPRKVNGRSPSKWDEFLIRTKEDGFCCNSAEHYLDSNVFITRTGLGEGVYEVKTYHKLGCIEAKAIEIIFH